MDEQQTNWTELLEKEWMPAEKNFIEAMRRNGHSDEETYGILESFG